MHKKRFLLSVTLISILLISTSATDSVKPKWQKYTHTASNSQILFPGDFTEKVKVKESSNGEEYRTTKVTSMHNNIVYFFGITMHASDFVYSEDLEDISINAFLKGVGGTETARNVWERKGKDGVEVTLDTQDAEMTYRVLIVDKKQVQVVIARPKAEEINPKTRKKFLKSFKMK